MMATIEQCQQALETLAAKMAASIESGVKPPTLQRSVSCLIPDLDTGFHAELRDGKLDDITHGEDTQAQITLTINSDDLVALANGELDFTSAWATNRLRIDASFMDLLKLRNIF